MEDGDVEQGHGGHVPGVEGDARSARADALVEMRVRNDFSGLGHQGGPFERRKLGRFDQTTALDTPLESTRTQSGEKTDS
jgi:hypothetical protein